jgi:cysteinyl-tRNA synthetase
MHNGFVTVNGVKMSKSLGNFISIEDALEMAPAEVWRFVVLSTHYANPIDFSITRKEGDETVRGTVDIAFDRVEYFYETLNRAAEALKDAEIQSDVPLMDDERVLNIVSAFKEAMDDDFNTAKALAHIGEVMKFVNELCDMKAKQIKKLKGGRASWHLTLKRILDDLQTVLKVLNLCSSDPHTALEQMRDFSVKTKGLDKNFILSKINDRIEARAQKEWEKSDKIRDELLAMGVELRDSATGTVWKVIR